VIAETRGARDEAERHYEQAAAAAPDQARYRATLARIYLDRRSQGDRLDRAVREARRTVELDPDDAEAYYQLGLAYVAAAKLPQAARALEHAMDLQPGFGPPTCSWARSTGSSATARAATPCSRCTANTKRSIWKSRRSRRVSRRSRGICPH
jgi:tetratricopeptide (TPR) repeat protein